MSDEPNCKSIRDIPVISINQLIPIKDQFCIVISVSPDIQAEIVEKLSQLEFTNIIYGNEYVIF
jgi:hypothetical protein